MTTTFTHGPRYVRPSYSREQNRVLHVRGGQLSCISLNRKEHVMNNGIIQSMNYHHIRIIITSTRTFMTKLVQIFKH